MNSNYYFAVVSKLDQLKQHLREGGRTLIAYSGGVDSTFLAKVAYDSLKQDSLAVIADSPSLPRRELQEALAVADEFEFPVRIIRTKEFLNESYTRNPLNRCYFCKSELFSNLAAIASKEGWRTIAYGENASDKTDFRPGTQAASEFGVRAPLKEVGLTKAEIRELSANFGLPTSDKPEMPCLSSRIPYGESVTTKALAMIEAGEQVLREAGFSDVRVRHHKDVARIEVGCDEIQRFAGSELRNLVTQGLKKIGYAYVTLDLQGYRRGSTNEVLT